MYISSIITKHFKLSMIFFEIYAARRSHRIVCILHYILIAWTLLFLNRCNITMASSSHINYHQKSYDIKEMIVELQCYAKCEEEMAMSMPQNNELNDFTKCRDQCVVETKKSPRQGNCPAVRLAIFQNLPQRLDDLSCVESCSHDFDCPNIQKCCPSSCGSWVCMTPTSPLRDVPPIPKILRYKLPRGHKVEIAILTALNSSCLYHVEARSHIGLLYSPRKFGPWHWQPVEKLAETIEKQTKRIDVAFNVKPCRWYQVRVAAINSNGFAGYSEPSKAFSLVNRPKPPKAPAQLKVVSTTVDGNFLNAKIVWCPSKSNLPVDKYKITWSLYVKFKGDSLISNESFVRNTHQFVITKLLPDSSYYIQVQAMTAIGKRRLKSEKTSILYNTTTIDDSIRTTIQRYETPLKCGNDNRHFRDNEQQIETNTEQTPSAITNSNHSTYEVHYLMNRKLGMIVRISGFHPHKEKVYELCPKETKCEQREYSAIRVKKNSLEFSKLKYNTSYILKAHEEKNVNGNRPFIFTTPNCDKFGKKYPKMQIQC